MPPDVPGAAPNLFQEDLKKAIILDAAPPDLKTHLMLLPVTTPYAQLREKMRATSEQEEHGHLVRLQVQQTWRWTRSVRKDAVDAGKPTTDQVTVLTGNTSARHVEK